MASQASETSGTPAHSVLQRTRTNLTFLANPETATRPSSRGTRAFLRTTRYILKFLFWRLIRYAKYAAVGSLTALVAGTAIGSVASGAAFVVAPTGLFGGAAIGLLWGVGRFGWRRFARRAKDGAGDARMDEKRDAQGEKAVRIKAEQEQREKRVLKADPW